MRIRIKFHTRLDHGALPNHEETVNVISETFKQTDPWLSANSVYVPVSTNIWRTDPPLEDAGSQAKSRPLLR